MVERYIEVTDEYVKQWEQERDNIKKIKEKHKKRNRKLREENKKQKGVIDKIKKEVNEQHTIMGCEVVENWVLIQILEEKEVTEWT